MGSSWFGLLVCLCCVSCALNSSLVLGAVSELCLFVVGGVLFVCLVCCLSVLACGFPLELFFVLICWFVLPVCALPGAGSWCEFCWVWFMGVLGF